MMIRKKQRDTTNDLPQGTSEEEFQAWCRIHDHEARKYNLTCWEFFPVNLHPDSPYAVRGPRIEPAAPGETDAPNSDRRMAESWPRARRIRLEELKRNPHYYDLANKYVKASDAELAAEEK